MENNPDNNVQKIQKKQEIEKTLKQDYAVTKFASFLLIISFIGILFSVFSVLSFLVVLLYYLILILIMFLTLFTLLPKLQPWFDKGQDIQNFIAQTYAVLPYVLGASLVLAVTALLIFIFKKNYIHRRSRIIFTSIVLFITVIIFIIRFLLSI